MNRVFSLPKKWLWVAAAAILLVALHNKAFCANNDKNIINIGVLSGPDTKACQNHWQATAEYLTAEIDTTHFTIQPLSETQLNQAAYDASVQFLIVDPYHYVMLAQIHQIQPVLTLKRLRHGKGYAQTASVIFSRHDNPRIRILNDLVGKTFMAVSESSFIGWRNTLYEFHAHGIAPEFDFEQIAFGQTHSAVVMAVRDGLVAAGTVAAGTLESMAAQGIITRHSFRILNQATADGNHFPFLRSTGLTPEWPLAVMPYVPRRLTEKVARRLLALTPESDAAQAAQLAGWTPALNYQSVHATILKARQHAHSKITLPNSIGVYALICFAVLTAGFVGAIWLRQHNGSYGKRNATSARVAKRSETQAKSPPAGSVNATSRPVSGSECLVKQHENNCQISNR